LIGTHWVSREDVGVPNSQEGPKGRVSDALKRTARKFGVGLHLCFLDKKNASKSEEENSSDNGTAVSAQRGTPAKPNTMPRSGPELEARLKAFDDRLAAEGVCMDGDLLLAVSHALSEAGFGLDTRTWPQEAIRLAVQEAKDFEARAREKLARKESTRQRVAEKVV
jgi:hypothetical protein